MELDDQLLAIIRSEIRDELRASGLPQIGLATNASSYSTGNVLTKMPGQTTTPNTGDRILQAYTQGSGPAANDLVVYARIGGQLLILGKLQDVASLPALDAVTWRGAAWIIPGDAVTSQSANTERSTIDTNFETLKIFRVSRPGRYRLPCEIHRDSSNFVTITVRAAIVTEAGVTILAASNEQSTTSTTYVSKTLDMTVNAFPGEFIGVQVKTSNAASAGYIQNVSLNYSEATANPTLTDVVILD